MRLATIHEEPAKSGQVAMKKPAKNLHSALKIVYGSSNDRNDKDNAGRPVLSAGDVPPAYVEPSNRALDPGADGGASTGIPVKKRHREYLGATLT